MALPKHYLTTIKNLDSILTAIQTARAPQVFNRRFLEGLDFKSSSDRLIINVLKSLGFLSSDNRPTERYYQYLDQSQAGRVMAEAVREAYGDLYDVHKDAHELSKRDVKNKLRTLSRGEFSESVLDKMALTFKALAQHADFEAVEQHVHLPEVTAVPDGEAEESADGHSELGTEDEALRKSSTDSGIRLGGLVYNIQIHLPESRDQAVYDALFRSLKAHILQ